MSRARSTGNRKLIFAMIERNRSAVTETLHNRYVTQCHGMSHVTGNAYAMRTHTNRISNNNLISHAISEASNEAGKGSLEKESHGGCHDREFRADVSDSLTFFLSIHYDDRK